MLSLNLVRSSLELIYLKRYMVVKGTQAAWWEVFAVLVFDTHLISHLPPF